MTDGAALLVAIGATAVVAVTFIAGLVVVAWVRGEID